MPEPLVNPRHLIGWTVDDLNNLLDNGMRHEILEGCLLVSPAPSVSHGLVTDRLTVLLKSQAPDETFVTSVGIGVNIHGGRSYFVPDVVAVRKDALATSVNGFDPSEVLLVVEVLSQSNARTDLVLKRHDYAAEGIPVYWIVDPINKTLSVLEHDGEEHYRETARLSPGERLTTETPFPMSIDLAEIL
jgi:Uma2 family endonuclease